MTATSVLVLILAMVAIAELVVLASIERRRRELRRLLRAERDRGAQLDQEIRRRQDAADPREEIAPGRPNGIKWRHDDPRFHVKTEHLRTWDVLSIGTVGWEELVELATKILAADAAWLDANTPCRCAEVRTNLSDASHGSYYDSRGYGHCIFCGHDERCHAKLEELGDE